MVDVDGSCVLHRRLGKPVGAVSEAERDRTKRIVYSIIYGVGKLADSDRKIAEWLACWTQAQKGPGSNRSRDAVG